MSADDCRVTVCRGCCCGQEDPQEAKERLKILRAALGHLRISDCLGPCDHRDVIVVTPGQAMRRRKVRPVWLGWMADSRALTDLVGWIQAGGPGRADLPEGLRLCVFRPTKRAKRAS